MEHEYNPESWDQSQEENFDHDPNLDLTDLAPEESEGSEEVSPVDSSTDVFGAGADSSGGQPEQVPFAPKHTEELTQDNEVSGVADNTMKDEAENVTEPDDDNMLSAINPEMLKDGVVHEDAEHSALGNQMIDFISDIENRLQQFKTASETQDKITSAIEQEEIMIADQRAELDARQSDLNVQEELLAEEREAIDSDIAKTDTLKSELDQQQNEMKQQRTDLQQAKGDLEKRSEALNQRWEEIEKAATLIEQDEDDLKGRMNACEDKEDGLKSQATHLEEETQQVASKFAEIEERETRVNGKAEEVASHGEGLARELAELERRSNELDTQNEEISKTRDELQELSESQEQKRLALDERTQQIATAAEKVAQEQDHLDAERELITAERNEIEQERKSITEISAALQLKKDKLDQLRDEAADACKIREELLEERQLLQSQQMDVEKERASITNLSAELQQKKEKLDTLQGEADEVIKQQTQLQGDQQRLDEQHEKISHEQETINDLSEAMAQKNDKLDQLQKEADQAEVHRLEVWGDRAHQYTEMKATCETLQSEIDKREQEIEQLKAAAEESAKTAKAEEYEGNSVVEELEKEIDHRDEAIEKLTSHFRELQGEYENAQSHIEDLKTAQAANDTAHATVLQKIEQSTSDQSDISLALAARRRERLRKQRNLLRQKAGELSQARSHIDQHSTSSGTLNEQHRLLRDVKLSLMQAEKVMVRKWARANAISQLFWCTLLTVLLAGASYFGVMEFWPAQFIANATVSAKSKPGFPMTETQLATWQAVHEQAAFGDAVLKAASERFRQRGFKELASTASLGSFLKDRLALQSTQDGSLNLSLISIGELDTVRILETYSIAYVSVMNANRGKRSDGGATSLSDPATIEPTAVKDDRLEYAGMVFGGSMFLVFGFGTILFAKLKRVQKVLDKDGDLFAPIADDARWAEMQQNASSTSREHIIG